MKAKLVRDRIPKIIENSGRACRYRIVYGNERLSYLHKKMQEELDEFAEEPCAEEAADMYEVLRSLCLEHAISMEVVENIAMKKRVNRGGFLNGYVLERVEEPESQLELNFPQAETKYWNSDIEQS